MNYLNYCFKIFLLIGLLAGLISCTPTTPEQRFKGMTSEQIFQRGETALAKGKYAEAIKFFEGLEALYPFGPYAQQGQMDIIYAYYKNGDSASAIAAADRYIHLYPQAANVDYAYYMKGLVNYDRGRNWLQKRFGVSASENDVANIRQSFSDFNEFLIRFPDSKYAGDARRRMVYIRDILAKHELETAQYYYRKGAYVAAINRASYVVEHFQTAPEVVPALVIMVKANRALGLQKPADDALRVLQLNYPNSKAAASLNK